MRAVSPPHKPSLSYGNRNLGLRKPAAAFPEPARWPGPTQAHLPTRPLGAMSPSSAFYELAPLRSSPGPRGSVLAPLPTRPPSPFRVSNLQFSISNFPIPLPFPPLSTSERQRRVLSKPGATSDFPIPLPFPPLSTSERQRRALSKPGATSDFPIPLPFQPLSTSERQGRVLSKPGATPRV